MSVQVASGRWVLGLDLGSVQPSATLTLMQVPRENFSYWQNRSSDWSSEWPKHSFKLPVLLTYTQPAIPAVM
jgi:hypothetical protein